MSVDRENVAALVALLLGLVLAVAVLWPRDFDPGPDARRIAEPAGCELHRCR